MHEKPKDDRWVLREAAAKYVPGPPPAEEEWVSAADFKQHCLRLIEQMQQGRGPVVVTRYGKPVARLVPYEEKPVSIFGHISGAVIYHDDLVASVDEAWEADA